MEANADRLIELFHEARARAAMGELDHFLGDRCCDEPELKGQLISLLQVHDQIGDFLQTGPPHLVSEIAAEKPGDKLGPYKLIEQIGEGGCGVVYLAEQEYPVRRRVALKVIKLGMDTRSVVARFEAERQALALMDHPHIAKVLEAGATATGRPYFVMELVRGARITEYCQQARLPIEQRLRLLIQICNAVQHAHQKGIIHRDLKPSNILVTLHDGAPVPKVIDFGIAKATADQRLTDRTVFTAVEQFLGTPAYMSPEQAEMGELDIDTRSDIYSLGVLLYELLTGHTPFDTQELTRSGLGEMRRIIREQEPIRPSTRFARGSDPRESQSRDGKSEIPQDLDWIVMKCLEKDRARRYSTANGLSADLERHLNNEPVVARPPSTSYRIQKAFRRHKWAFASASAVVAALVLGLFASLWLNMKATRAQHEAERQAYILKMNLARQAWDDNDIGRLRRLLQQTAAYRDRGFEWYYWQQQCHLELRTLRGHAAPVMDVSFSPDSKRVLTASLDGTAIVWDSNRGAEIRTFDGHHGGMTSAAWSPDGQKIVTAGASGTALIWDAVSGVQLVTLQGHSGRLTSARFSPDGERIVTASFDRTARVWRSATGEEILTLTNGSTVWSAAFSPNGQTIVTASSDETANVWNATNGSRLLTIRPSSARHPSMVGDYMAFYAGFSPDGSLIVTLGQNQVASFWDAVTGAWRFDLKGNPHWLSPRQTEVPLTVSFSHDNGRIIMGGLDFAPSVWRLEGYTNLFILKGHEAEIVASAFSPDGRRIVTGSYDHTAKIWNAAGTSEVTYLGGHTNIVVSSAYSPDGGRLATASWDGTANVWETANGALLFALNHGDTLVWCVAFSADGTRIVTGTQGGTWSVWDAFTSRQLLSITNSHGRELYSVGFSRDGNRVLTAGGDGTAKVWDASTGRELLVLPHNQPLVMAVFSPDGRRIASVCNDNNRNTLEEATAAVWDAQTGRKVFDLAGKHLNGFSAVAFSPDGRLIVTGSVDWTATVWDASNGKDLHVLRGHHGQVIHVGVSPDCQRIFTGGFDNTTRVWDVTTGQEMLTHKGRFFLGQGISPDGRRIVVGAEPPVIVWKVASPEQVATWRAEERMLAKQMNADR